MTPEQRKYDLDLAASMLKMAKWVAPRSRKISDVLMLGAQRIQAYAGEKPVDPELQQPKSQPASAPDTYNR